MENNHWYRSEHVEVWNGGGVDRPVGKEEEGWEEPV